jgi:membrane fusion protein
MKRATAPNEVRSEPPRTGARPDAPTPLFRPEAVAAQRTAWLGTVLLARPLSHSLFVLFALFAIVSLGTLATFGEFTRKAKVNGWLVPEQGLVRVFAPQSSVVADLRVREGAVVKRGEPLLVLSAERESSMLGATQAGIARLLSQRRSSLLEEQQRQRQLTEQQRASLLERVRAMNDEIRQLSQEIDVQASRVQLAEGGLERQRGLQGLGYVSMQQLQAQEEQVLEQRGRLRGMERQRSERQRELAGVRAELQELPIKGLAQVAAFDRNVATLEQELAEAEARRQIVVPAPQSGTVAALQVEVGSTASPATPLMSIVPTDSSLEAHLFTPSRSIGFIREGQPVLIRYQAFPYQKFGHHAGTVASVSRTAVSPGELPAQLSGLSALVGSGEPVYRIVVRLDRQSVLAYGRQQALQSGMQLEADIALERRRLYEWLLEPLYTLTGRL